MLMFTLCLSTRCSSSPRDEAIFCISCLCLASAKPPARAAWEGNGVPLRSTGIAGTVLNSVPPHVDVSYRSLYYKSYIEW